MAKKDFMLGNKEKGAILGDSKTALTKFRKSFFPEILWSSFNVRVFWNAEAFSFNMILLRTKTLLVLWAWKHFVRKKFV